MNILQDVKENQFHQPGRMSKSSSTNNTKKVSASKFGASYQIQMQIGIAYNQVLQLVKQNGYNKEIKLPEDGTKSLQKLELIKKTVQKLIEINRSGKSQPNKNNQRKCDPNQEIDQSNIISCLDCQNYQNNLQKLQNQVRQHIRLQQQLKIYQQSMEQKIQQLKKQKSITDKKHEDLKKKYQQHKHNSNGYTEKLNRLQYQNQKLKAQIKQLKNSNFQSSKKIKGYESRDKQNRIDWVHRMSSLNKKQQNDYHKPQKQHHKDKTHSTHTDKHLTHTDRTSITDKDRTDRKSIQKRGDSTQRWRMSGARSTKLINFNQKIIQDKNKQERKKAIQSKFQYRK